MTTTPAVHDRGLTFAEHRAFGPLGALLDDPRIRDILVQVSPGGGEVWVDRGDALTRVPDLTPSPEAVRESAVSLIAAGGRHIDELHPCANVRLGHGIRVHAILAPIVHEGAAISIRFPNTSAYSLEDLAGAGLCDTRTAQILRRTIVAKGNVLVTGATGSGKTTLLAALLSEVPHTERIVSIEDVQELTIVHPHHVALEARQANTEGMGAVSLDRLLTETLRMRPDRIVVGECRGAELTTLMSALNTGHDGGAGTLHANSVDDVPARLEALGMLGGLSPETLARQAASAFDLIVHVERRQGAHSIVACATLALDTRGMLTLDRVTRMADVRA